MVESVQGRPAGNARKTNGAREVGRINRKKKDEMNKRKKGKLG